MIIVSSANMLHVYCKLFNSILCLTHYPQTWKRGILTNLFKTGDPSQTDNYRGRMINSCIGKVFNTIINNRLVKFLCDNNKICKEQIGFKKNARTSDHLFVMNVLLQKYQSTRKNYTCVSSTSRKRMIVYGGEHWCLKYSKLVSGAICLNSLKICTREGGGGGVYLASK